MRERASQVSRRLSSEMPGNVWLLSAVTPAVVVVAAVMAAARGMDCYRCRSRNFSDRSCHDPFSKTAQSVTRDCHVRLGSAKLAAAFCVKVDGTSGKGRRSQARSPSSRTASEDGDPRRTLSPFAIRAGLIEA